MPELPQIEGILLAAGESKRYGEENKLLLSLQDQSVIHHSLKALLESKLESIYLVVGYQADLVIDSIGKLAQNRKLTILENRDWQTGQTSSKRLALQAMPEEIEGVLFCLGDMPLMTADLINRVVATFRKERQITFPFMGGIKGHPIIWPRNYWNELSGLGDEESGLGLVRAHWESASKIELVAEEAHTQWDVDTPSGYQRVLGFIKEDQ